MSLYVFIYFFIYLSERYVVNFVSHTLFIYMYLTFLKIYTVCLNFVLKLFLLTVISNIIYIDLLSALQFSSIWGKMLRIIYARFQK